MWRLVIIMVAALFLAGCPLPWNAAYITVTDTVDFDMEDTLQTIVVWGEHHIEYESWRVKVSEPWILVTPTEGSLTGGNYFSHEVRVERQLPAGQHIGYITFEVISGSVPIYNEVVVNLRTGEEIRGFDIFDNLALDSLFTCADSNEASGLDYWGVCQSESSDPYVWCAQRGEHQSRCYDNNMDAWMVLKPEYAVDVNDFERINIGFRLNGSSDQYRDYLELILLNPDGQLIRPRYLPVIWSDWHPEDLVSVPLTSFNIDSLAYPLRFAFFFHSDSSGVKNGYWLEDLKVFGDPKTAE